MKNYIFLLLVAGTLLSSCESKEARIARELRDEQYRIELAEKAEKREQERVLQQELERIEKEIRLEKQRKEKAIYDKYINNSLSTGSTPYAYCYGRNKSCSNWGCSNIIVKTPSNSDVFVTIKKNKKVVKHAYINSGSSYTFELPNGEYQPFFYYGKGWNPEKEMKQTSCGMLKGGFISNESFDKDLPQFLRNEVLTYELILQQNGNLQTKPSNANEAL
jgi:hypothetical protein